MTERELIRRMFVLLARGITKQGHLAQIKTNEHRGNCLPPKDGCTPTCSDAQDVILAADKYLTETETRQVDLFGEAM